MFVGNISTTKCYHVLSRHCLTEQVGRNHLEGHLLLPVSTFPSICNVKFKPLRLMQSYTSDTNILRLLLDTLICLRGAFV